MLSSKLLSLGGIILGVIALIGVEFLALKDEATPFLGATNTKFVGILPVYLSGAGISATVTSIGVTSATIKQTGQVLSITDFGSTAYLTLEPGSAARQEFVSCTGLTQNTNGTATFTSCTRGLSPVSPYTASSTVRFAHGGGTTVIISNSPPFYNNFALKNNDEDITGIWTSITPTQSNQLVTKSYVDSGILAGGATSTESVTGIVRLATALQQASSSPTTANTPLVLQAQYATDTPLSGCAVGYTSTAGAGCSVVAQLTGKIRQTFINLAEAYTWSGYHIFSTSRLASTTIDNPVNLGGLSYTFPTTRCASGQALIENGSGTLSCKYVTGYSYAGAGPNASTGTATTTLFTIPAGMMTASSTIEVDWQGTSLANGGGGTVYLKASPDTTIVSSSCTEATNAETAQCVGHMLVSFNSATAQSTQTSGMQESQQGVGVVNGGGGTSAVSFSGAVTLIFSAQAQNASNNMNVTALSVVVTP